MLKAGCAALSRPTGLQLFHREPQDNEGPQSHIAADARETIKKGPAWLNSEYIAELNIGGNRTAPKALMVLAFDQALGKYSESNI